MSIKTKLPLRWPLIFTASAVIAGIDAAAATQGLPGPTFEVASVKLTDRPRSGESRVCKGGPGTADPLTWTCAHVALKYLLFTAYDLEFYQYRAPNWMEETWLSVNAKVPAGTTKAEFCMMQQSLLAERFKLAAHWGPKEMMVYEISVDKNGSKMRESPAGSPLAVTQLSSVPGMTKGPDEYPVLPEGISGYVGLNNFMHWRSSSVTMQDIVKVLRAQVESDLIDMTGLTGKYDIDMQWQQRPIEYFPKAPPFVTPIEKALQERLGLKLQAKKGWLILSC